MSDKSRHNYSVYVKLALHNVKTTRDLAGDFFSCNFFFLLADAEMSV